MEQLNFTIQRANHGLVFDDVSPHELGVENANIYLTFLYNRITVTVWTTAELDTADAKVISRKLLSMVREKTDGREH